MALTADRNFPSYKLVQQNDYDDSLERQWNTAIAAFDLPFRNFHVGGKSTVGSRTKWFDIYLKKHAKDFGIFKKDPHPEKVYEEFSSILLASLTSIRDAGLTVTNERLGANYNARLTIWSFINPPTNLLYLSGRQEFLDDDQQRRKDKSQAMRELEIDWAETLDKIGYLLKTGEQIKSLRPALSNALAEVEMQVEKIAEWEND